MRRLPGMNLARAFVLLMCLVPIAVSGQKLRIAELSMSLIAGPHMYPDLAAAVGRYDVVAADEIEEAGAMEKVLAGMDDDWQAIMSKGGSLGFFYNDRILLLKELGRYPEKGSCPVSLWSTVQAFRIGLHVQRGRVSSLGEGSQGAGV